MRRAVSLGALGLIATAAAQAAPVAISNAAYAATFVRDCRSLANTSSTPDRCEVNGNFSRAQGVSTLMEVRESMALGGISAATAATHALGMANTPTGVEATRSQIDASGAAGVLLLRQGAFSIDYSRVSGHSLGLQSFQFTGLTGEVRSIQNVLDFTSNVTPSLSIPTQAAPGTELDAVTYAKTRVTVFSLSTANFSFDPGQPFDVQSGGFWSQASALSDFVLEAQVDDLGIQTSGHTTQLNFAMTNGRYYFVESYLGLWARFGGQFDATHTFTSTLGRSQGGSFVASMDELSAAPQSANPVLIGNGFAVPTPGTLASALLGLALLGATRRRRTH